MKKFYKFVQEDKDDDATDDTKKAVVNFIVSNFYRFVNSPDESDNKSLLMLVAALTVLNADQPNATQVARRLAQMALVRSGRKKG